MNKEGQDILRELERRDQDEFKRGRRKKRSDHSPACTCLIPGVDTCKAKVHK